MPRRRFGWGRSILTRWAPAPAPCLRPCGAPGEDPIYPILSLVLFNNSTGAGAVTHGPRPTLSGRPKAGQHSTHLNILAITFVCPPGFQLSIAALPNTKSNKIRGRTPWRLRGPTPLGTFLRVISYAILYGIGFGQWYPQKN